MFTTYRAIHEVLQDRADSECNGAICQVYEMQESDLMLRHI